MLWSITLSELLFCITAPLRLVDWHFIRSALRFCCRRQSSKSCCSWCGRTLSLESMDRNLHLPLKYLFNGALYLGSSWFFQTFPAGLNEQHFKDLKAFFSKPSIFLWKSWLPTSGRAAGRWIKGQRVSAANRQFSWDDMAVGTSHGFGSHLLIWA